MGLFDFIGDIFEDVVDIVVEVAPIALGAAAVVFTGGSALGLTAGWGTVAGALGGIAGEGLLGGILSGALQYAGYGALAGGVMSAISGGDILKGMKKGMLSGAVTGGILGGLDSAGIFSMPGITKPTDTPLMDLMSAPPPTTGLPDVTSGTESGSLIQGATTGGEGVDALAGEAASDTLGGATTTPGDLTIPSTQPVGQDLLGMPGGTNQPGLLQGLTPPGKPLTPNLDLLKNVASGAKEAANQSWGEKFLNSQMGGSLLGNAALGVGMSMMQKDPSEAEADRMARIQGNYGDPQALADAMRLRRPIVPQDFQMREQIVSGQRGTRGGRYERSSDGRTRWVGR